MSILSYLRNVVEDGKYNRDLYASGAADRGEVRQTAVGWRPDPIHKQDGMTPDPGNDCIVGIDPVTGYPIYDTPSGNLEFYRVVRKR